MLLVPRTSYFLLFTVFAMLYFGQILIFTLFFFGITKSYPQCINSAGSMIGTGDGARLFGDCFQLSWTTFSTVVSWEWETFCSVISALSLNHHISCANYTIKHHRGLELSSPPLVPVTSTFLPDVYLLVFLDHSKPFWGFCMQASVVPSFLEKY